MVNDWKKLPKSAATACGSNELRLPRKMLKPPKLGVFKRKRFGFGRLDN